MPRWTLPKHFAGGRRVWAERWGAEKWGCGKSFCPQSFCQFVVPLGLDARGRLSGGAWEKGTVPGFAPRTPKKGDSPRRFCEDYLGWIATSPQRHPTEFGRLFGIVFSV